MWIHSPEEGYRPPKVEGKPSSSSPNMCRAWQPSLLAPQQQNLKETENSQCILDSSGTEVAGQIITMKSREGKQRILRLTAEICLPRAEPLGLNLLGTLTQQLENCWMWNDNGRLLAMLTERDRHKNHQHQKSEKHASPSVPWTLKR